MNSRNEQDIIVVTYGRVSSKEQAENGLSLDMQKDVTAKWAKARFGNKCTIVHFEDAGKTGTNMNRPGIKNLLKFIKHNRVECVVVWKLDRLSRCQEDFFGEIQKPIKNYNSTIASITENFDDIRKVKKVLLGVISGQLEDEVDNTKDRTRTVLQHRVEQGYKLGLAPVGYINTRDSHKHGIIVPDKEKAHYIKRTFELYATGQISMDNLGKEMYKYGFANKYNKPYKKNFFERMLKNPVYVGKIEYKGVLYDGVHTPLISAELFYRVQLMFSETRKLKSHNEEFVYSNYIKCAKCGYSMLGILKHGAHKSGNYIYYHCSNYTKAHKKEKNIRQELIDEAMQEVLESFDISENDLKKIKTRIFSALSELQEYEHKSLKELKNKYDKLVDVIANSIKKKLSGELDIDDTTYNELQRKWQKEKDLLAIKISELSSNSNEKITRVNILTDFANRIPELYLKASPKDKRLILATITDSIEYDEDTNTLRVKLKPVFEELRQRKLAEKVNFSAKVKALSGTLKTRSTTVETQYQKIAESLNVIEETGTHKRQATAKIIPIFRGREKANVDGGT